MRSTFDEARVLAQTYDEVQACFMGSDDLADYGNDVGLNPFYPETIDPCLIYAKNAIDIGISGEGKIVGHAKNTFAPPSFPSATAAGFFPASGSTSGEPSNCSPMAFSTTWRAMLTKSLSLLERVGIYL